MKSFLLVLLLALTPAAVFAQATSAASATPVPTVVPMWRCTLPGGTYEVLVRAMLAVSTHEYLVDGAVRVTECNIDTSGTLLARFYYIEPNTPTTTTPSGLGIASVDKATQLLTQASSSTGLDAWQKVVKSYPTSTHAHTVEYRLTSKDQVTQIFQSAETAFRTGRNGTFSASE